MSEPAGKTLGKTMIVMMWLLFLGLLTWFFSDLLEQQFNPNRDLDSGITAGGVREIRLLQNRQGHYVTPGEINQHEVVFLLDTGATTISIPENVALRIGLSRGRTQWVSTANGNIQVYLTRIKQLKMGDIHLDNVVATINPYMDGEGILMGMNVLKHLELIQRDRVLTIRQHPE